jgi:hypothetical protein
MGAILQKILGLNWGTTLAGITVIVAAVGRIVLAYRTRDFEAIFSDGQLVLTTLTAILAGLGLISAKDRNVTGAGITAKAVDSSGVVTNVKGDEIGKQPVP